MNDAPGAEPGQPQAPAVGTAPASSPQPVPASGPRRSSRRRRLLVTSVALVGVSLVAGAGVLLVSGLPRSGGRVTPTTTASAGGTTSPAGAAEVDRKDVGLVPAGDYTVRIDASVFLLPIDLARQQAIRRQLAALPAVQQFAYESQAEAFRRYRVMFRNQPRRLRGVSLGTLPASFRVVLHDPRQFSELFRAFCPQLGPDGKPACVRGVEVVVDQHQVTWEGLAGPWLHATDAAVFLTSSVDPDQREVIGRDLEALAVVEQVDFESRAAALRRLQQQGVKDPLVLHDYAVDSFRVRLSEPKQFPELYGRLCSGRWSFSTQPVCKPGVGLVIANPRSVYYGLER